MNRSKAARQVRGWMDFYAYELDGFADLVANVGGCSADAVVNALVGDRRPAFVVARAIQEVTRVDAHDWFIEEPRARAACEPAPVSETVLLTDEKLARVA